MPDDKKQVEQEDLEQKIPEETLEVPIDDEGNVKSEDQKKKDEETARIQREEQSKKNAEAAQRRIDQEKRKLKQENETLAKRLAELEKKATPLNQFGVNQPIPQGDAYWEKKLAENPTAALREFYRYERQQEREAEERVAQQQQMVEGYSKAVQESIEMAYEEIPALKDESSDEYVTYMGILERHPEWLQSPMGPMKVVREMKKLARESGVETKGNTERVRLARIANQPLSGVRSAEKPRSVTLTREQLQHCRENNIKPEDFAKYQLKLANGEGVQV
jgi:preprotein translocase subunit SecD